MEQFADSVYRLALVRHELHGFINHLAQRQKLMLVAAEIIDLLLRHFGGRARQPQDQKQRTDQFAAARGAKDQRLRRDSAVASESNPIEQPTLSPITSCSIRVASAASAALVRARPWRA
jgi:hypothetical protein